MNIETKKPPRVFAVGLKGEIMISHTADIALQPDEQVTFTAPSGSEFDVVRKSWGYYGTPSLNRRLRDHGLRAVLVQGRAHGGMYLLLVEKGCEDEFRRYMDTDNLRVISWLDDDHACNRAALALTGDAGMATKSHD